MIKSAFYCEGETEYHLDFTDLGVGYEGPDILFAWKARRLEFGGARYYTAVRRFDSLETAKSAGILTKSIRTVQHAPLSDQMQRELLAFVKKQWAKRNKKRQADAQLAADEAERQRRAEEARRAEADAAARRQADAEEEAQRLAAAAEEEARRRAAAEEEQRRRSDPECQAEMRRQRFLALEANADNEYAQCKAYLAKLDVQRAAVAKRLHELNETRKRVAKTKPLFFGSDGAVPSDSDMEVEAEDDTAESTPVVANSLGPGETVTLLYVLRGRAGKVTVKPDGSILFHELEEGLVSPTDENESERDRKALARSNFVLSNHGSKWCWKPAGTILKATNKMGKLVSDSDRIRKLRYLFSKKQCMFSRKSFRRYVTGTSVVGYGMSDRAMFVLLAGYTRALLLEMELPDISNLDIAQGLPSRNTISRGEGYLHTDGAVLMRQDIEDDGTFDLAGTFDHGHRKGQEHFVKNVHHAGYDEQGRKTIKSRVLDVNAGPHSAKGAAEAIKRSFSILIDPFEEDDDMAAEVAAALAAVNATIKAEEEESEDEWENESDNESTSESSDSGGLAAHQPGTEQYAYYAGLPWPPEESTAESEAETSGTEEESSDSEAESSATPKSHHVSSDSEAHSSESEESPRSETSPSTAPMVGNKH